MSEKTVPSAELAGECVPPLEVSHPARPELGLGAQIMKKTQIQCLAMFALGLSFCVACIVVVSPSSRAQTTYGSISGIVTDPSGARPLGGGDCRCPGDSNQPRHLGKALPIDRL